MTPFKWTVAVCCVAAGFLLGGAVRTSGLFGEVTAAWVQAVGTVVAIVASVFMSLQIEQRSAARTRDEVLRRDTAIARSGLEAIKSALLTLAIVRPTIDATQESALQINDWQNRLETARRKLEILVGPGRPPPDLVVPLFEAGRALEPLLADWKTIDQGYGLRFVEGATIQRHCIKAQAELEDLALELGRAWKVTV